MKTVYPLVAAMLLIEMSPVQAAGNGMNESHRSHYNPWRPQQEQWRYQSHMNGHPDNGHAMNTHQQGHSHIQVAAPGSQYLYQLPPHPVHARQAEYRQYVQQVYPYYGSNGLPWWSDPLAVPYGPWAIGNGWPNGLW